MAWASRGQVRSRATKAVGISVCLSISYFMLRAATTANRMQRDEIYVSDDLLRVIETGHLTEPAGYGAGNGYPVITGTVLEVLGGDYSALELISPFLGAVAIGLATVIAVALLRQLDSASDPWVAIAFPATMFVFGGFTIRLAESSHKTYTYSLVFLGLLAAFSCYPIAKNDGRWRLLFLVFTSGIALFNYVWALAYGMSIVLVLTLSGLPRDRVAVLGGIPPVVTYILPVYLPTGRINVRYIAKLTGQDVAEPDVVGEVGIAAWPAVTVSGVSFSSWYVFSAGVFVVALIAGIAGLHALWRVRADSPPIARFYVGVGVWFGLLAGAILAAGDLATFKRVIVIPASIGVLYALHTLSVTQVLTPRRRRLAMTAVVIVILAGAIVAIPRAVLDGDPAPYDYYADDNEIAKFEWWAEHAPAESCLRTHQFIDLSASHLVWGLERPGGAQPIPYDPRTSIVYTSGRESFLSCAQPPTERASPT